MAGVKVSLLLMVADVNMSQCGLLGNYNLLRSSIMPTFSSDSW